jgi:hypothetical protein
LAGKVEIGLADAGAALITCGLALHGCEISPCERWRGAAARTAPPRRRLSFLWADLLMAA